MIPGVFVFSDSLALDFAASVHKSVQDASGPSAPQMDT